MNTSNYEIQTSFKYKNMFILQKTLLYHKITNFKHLLNYTHG